jgi:hypothetical protein
MSGTHSIGSGLQRRYERFGEDKNLLLLARFEPRPTATTPPWLRVSTKNFIFIINGWILTSEEHMAVLLQDLKRGKYTDTKSRSSHLEIKLEYSKNKR